MLFICNFRLSRLSFKKLWPHGPLWLLYCSWPLLTPFLVVAPWLSVMAPKEATWPTLGNPGLNRFLTEWVLCSTFCLKIVYLKKILFTFTPVLWVFKAMNYCIILFSLQYHHTKYIIIRQNFNKQARVATKRMKKSSPPQQIRNSSSPSDTSDDDDHEVISNNYVKA